MRKRVGTLPEIEERGFARRQNLLAIFSGMPIEIMASATALLRLGALVSMTNGLPAAVSPSVSTTPGYNVTPSCSTPDVENECIVSVGRRSHPIIEGNLSFRHTSALHVLTGAGQIFSLPCSVGAYG